MILIDFSQLIIASLIEEKSDIFLDETIARHLVLNKIREHVKKFKKLYGPNIVIACDSNSYWRRDIFPYYKAKRKEDRNASKYNWDVVFYYMDIIKEELIKYSHYKIVEVAKCEADDIIGTLSIMAAAHEKIIIISTDKDFVQLQRFPNIEQYSPMTRKKVDKGCPIKFLKELIIQGDRKDGIPNIMSQDDSFVAGVRQKSVMKDKLQHWLNQTPQEFCSPDMLRNYQRNENLIDLTKVPEQYAMSILTAYENAPVSSKNDFLNYMIQKRMGLLIECIGEF